MTGIERSGVVPGRCLHARRFGAALCLCAAAVAVSAQPADIRLPPGVRGPEGAQATRGGAAMATRSVAKYLELERSLQAALERHDGAATSRLLAAGFEARNAAAPDATPQDEWMRRELAVPGERIVRDLSVREFDDVAVVSFVLAPATVRRSTPVPATLFVIDVWRSSTATLLVRYAEQPRKPPRWPSRPSGRE